MSLMRNCREVTRLVLAGEDRHLTAGERLGVRMHLMVCHGCTQFSRQVGVMRQALDRWRQQAGDEGDGTPPR